MDRLDQRKHDFDVLEHVLGGVHTSVEDDAAIVFPSEEYAVEGRELTVIVRGVGDVPRRHRR